MPLIDPFKYPGTPHVRKHGPRGYADVKSYKPWLRDEFQFRCVYCLVRECWHPDGDDGFSTEHLQSRLTSPELAFDYDNLLYACCRCNASKRDLDGILNPCIEPLANHILVSNDGAIHGLTASGVELIKICQLDRPKLIEFRHGIVQLLHTVSASDDQQHRLMLAMFFGFPSNLPRLESLRPPMGNSRPDGIGVSWYRLSERGVLPDAY